MDTRQVRHKILRQLQWGFMLLAVLTLAYQYSINRSLWLDEASLAINIQQRSGGELFQPLDHNQAAPVGFLLVTDWITTVLGISEYTLRLYPLLMGLATLLLFYWVGKQIQPHALLLGLALLATSSIHIRYATEFKQYITDGTFALLLTGLALQIVSNPSRRSIMLLAVTGGVAVWFSHPAIFVLAGVGTVLLVDSLRRRDWQTTIMLVAMGAVQAVSFLCVYLLFYQSVTHSTEIAAMMNRYWQDEFLRFSVESFVRLFLEIFVWVGGFNIVLLVLSIFGFIIGVRQVNSLQLALLLSPLVFMALASMLELYPASDRFLLFILPSIILVTSLGWWSALENILQAHRRVGWAMLVLLLALIVVRLDIPQYKMEARDAFQWIQTFSPSDDVVLATSRMGRIATYYQYDYQPLGDNLPDSQRLWIISEMPEQESLPALDEYSVYMFPGVFVLCVPGAVAECPPTASS
jgi:hypothetical protein